tara:strand:+ start:2365 stop:3900 length:1536 start_codon:yes stop_codon:yes gene_type:complete
MAANLGSMVATLTARTKPFDQKMKQSGSNLKGFGDKSKKVNDGLKEMAKSAMQAVASFVGFRKMISFLDQISAKMDKIVKTARGFNILTSQFMGLQFALEQFGVDGERVSQLLAKIQKAVFDAIRSPTGLQATIFQQLGLDIDKLAAQSPDQQLLTIFEALNNLQDAGLRTGLIMSLFGDRLGISLTNLAAQGTDAIQELIDQFQYLHGPVSDNMLQAMEDWQDTTNELSKAWDGFKLAIATTLARALKPLVSIMTEIIAAFNSTEPFIRHLIVNIGTLTAVVIALAAAYKMFSVVLKTVNALLASQLAAKIALLAVANPFLTALAGFTGLFVAIGLAMDDAESSSQALTAQLEQEMTAQLNAAEAAAVHAQRMQELRTKAEALKKQFRTPIQIFEEAVTGLVELATTIDDLTGSTFIDVNTFNQGLAQAIQQLIQASNIAEKIQNTLKAVEAVGLGTMAEVSARLSIQREGQAQQQYQQHVLRLQQQTNQLLQQISNNTGATLPVVNLVP